MTIVEMLARSADAVPDKDAVVQGSERLSYARLWQRVGSLAAYLRAAGLTKGDRVALLVEKSPDAIVGMMGVAAAGGVFFTLDHHHTSADLQYILDLTDPRALIVDAPFLPKLAGLRLPCADRVIVKGAGASGTMLSWTAALTCPSREAPVVKEDDPVYLNFTSGTTGTPKAAVTTHGNIVWNTRSSVEALGLTPDDVHLCMFPVFGHPHELFARPFLLGGTCVLTEGISPKAIVSAVRQHRATCMMATASIYVSLARYCRAQCPHLTSVRLGESGGMYISPRLAVELADALDFPVVPVWGSTETTGIALATPLSGGKPGSAGGPCPYYEIEVRDDHGRECPAGQVGEMVVRGPAVCAGYYGNPAETAKHMRDGWLYTGDLFRRDSDGFFYFAGRRSRMIKVAGLKVFPGEVEEVLSGHPAVEEAAVIKTGDRSRGEVPKAVIVRVKGSTLSRQDVRDYCEQHLSRYKVPRIIEFAEALPKSESGKILYRQLQEEGTRQAPMAQDHGSDRQVAG